MTIPRPLWRRLALAGFGIVLLACTAMGILSWFKQSNVNDHAIAADLDRSAHAILQDLAAQTRVDLAVAETVANEPGNAALVAADSRDEILRKYSPIVQPLKTQTGAGLVTFVKFDGTSVVAFARGHDPKAFGDDLSKRRKMVGVAVREGRAVMGIELGRAALCAFATVPWTVDGKVIGAVDVGTELTDAYFSRLKDVYGVDISLHLMRGTSLSPQNFTFPEKSFLSPDEAKAVFDGADVRKVVAKGDTHVAVTAVTLKDFSGGSIGVMEIAHDVTALIDAQRMSLEVTIASVVIVAILSLLLFTYFARSIARPIRALTQGMNRLAAGDLTVEIGGRGRADEIGAMAAAVQVFKDNAIALDQATLDRTRLAGETEAGRLKREGERVALAREQTNVVQSLATGLAHLSSGDLTHRIEGTLAIEYRALQEDFNAAVERLRETMEGVVSTARDILSGTSDIAKSSDDLSRRTEQQAAALEETSASMAEISRIVQTTAESARLGASVMASAKSSADQSAHIVHEAAGAMAAIEDSSRKIGNIIGVIDEIAFQTNLLALNAGVEAARAGDAGRGFAVVASEVRGLAQRSAEAAKEIKALIMASASQVEQGVTLVGRTEKALAEIAAQVIEMNTMVGAIAASADDQATSLGQVRTAITQMDHVTQQNAAMVEESTSAVHALAEEAAKLDGMVGHFKLGDDRAMGHAPVARNGAQYGKARRG